LRLAGIANDNAAKVLSIYLGFWKTAKGFFPRIAIPDGLMEAGSPQYASGESILA
jgi:hypothetical protein